MVNFQNDTTITRNAGEINTVQTLERRWYALETLKDFKELHFQNARSSGAKLRSAILVLFLEIEKTLSRKLEKKEFEAMAKDILNGSGDMIKQIRRINDILDDIGLTKLDNKRDYNRSNVEEEAKQYGC